MKDFKMKRFWFHWGVLRGVAIGFKIDDYGWDIDLIKIYFGMEW